MKSEISFGDIFALQKWGYDASRRGDNCFVIGATTSSWAGVWGRLCMGEKLAHGLTRYPHKLIVQMGWGMLTNTDFVLRGGDKW
ncbi:MAG: hypothetical protein V1889_00390 [archaeon]